MSNITETIFEDKDLFVPRSLRSGTYTPRLKGCDGRSIYRPLPFPSHISRYYMWWCCYAVQVIWWRTPIPVVGYSRVRMVRSAGSTGRDHSGGSLASTTSARPCWPSSSASRWRAGLTCSTGWVSISIWSRKRKEKSAKVFNRVD